MFDLMIVMHSNQQRHVKPKFIVRPNFLLMGQDCHSIFNLQEVVLQRPQVLVIQHYWGSDPKELFPFKSKSGAAEIHD